MIREMGKSPSVMLIDRPENFIDVTVDDGLFGYLKRIIRDKTALVFISTTITSTPWPTGY